MAARYTLHLLSVTNTTLDLQGALFPSLTGSGRLRSHVDVDIRHEFTKDLYVSLTGLFQLRLDRASRLVEQ